MLGLVRSCALLGIDAYPVAVEVDVAGGLPGYHVVGLPSTSVREGGTRIRSALERVGQTLPSRKVTVNLAPADRRKEGAAFDLPIAVGIMGATEVAALSVVDDLLLLGELGLDGSVRAVRGALSAAMLARRCGLRGIVLPADSAAEAAVVDNLEIYSVHHLGQVVAALLGEGVLPRYLGDGRSRRAPALVGDMSEIRGQLAARTAIEVAVAGGHNALLMGPPGIGKTMLARRIPGILPPMTLDESLETTQIYSAMGLAEGGLIEHRPFRAPHHTSSGPALLGGGGGPRPGEISLAHNGVLFLDELPEFPRGVLESLRQPLEDRSITLGRVRGTATFPASFLLVASANPCPCGWAGSAERVCVCGAGAIERYQNRLSGPLMDRMDLQIFVAPVSLAELRCEQPGEPSLVMRERVQQARERQLARLVAYGARTNAEMSPAALRDTCQLDSRGEQTLARLYQKRRGMTARSVTRLIKIARTIADLLGRERIDRDCLLEASSYRMLDSEPDLDERRLRGMPGSPSPSSSSSSSSPASSDHSPSKQSASAARSTE